MKFIISGILASAVAASGFAGAPKTELEAALRAGAGMQVDFIQRFTARGFTKGQTERGVVTFGSPPRMRWNYVAPEAKTFVFDGITSWLYSPADRQVTVSRITEEEKRAIPFLLISDPAALFRHFTIRERTRAGIITAEVKPRSSTALVREVVVTIDQSTRRIRTLSYSDRQDNKTVFQFSNYRRAPEADLAFRFTPPPGVDVIESQR